MHRIFQSSVALLLLCVGLGFLLIRERAARADVEARQQALLRTYAETVRRSGPGVPPFSFREEGR
jgi:hypothetical protein